MLQCGCLVGVYETYDGVVVATIDARGDSCRESEHRLHNQVSVNDPTRPLATTGPHQNVR